MHCDMKFAPTLIPLLIISMANAQSQSPAWTEIAYADEHLMGNYVGEWINPPEKSYYDINPKLSAQVINIEEGRYHVKFMQDLDRRAHLYHEGEARVQGKRIVYQSDDGWEFFIDEDGMQGTAPVNKNKAGFNLKRVMLESPTVGLKPPEGAIVLFDGSSLHEWEHQDGRPNTWHLLPDGVMEVNPKRENEDADPPIGGDINSRRSFGSVRAHLEFRYPVEPGKSAQGRGNSGFFFQGPYEVQILNSYGLDGLWNECGALYKLSPPHVNAARPPMQWQTYDVIYHAPKYSVGGELLENPRITVWLNGVLVQNDVELIFATSHSTTGRNVQPPMEPAPIKLQDHSNRLQFRNIWIEEL